MSERRTVALALAGAGLVLLAVGATMLPGEGDDEAAAYEILVRDAPDPSEILRLADLLCKEGIPHRIEDGGRVLSVSGSSKGAAAELLLAQGLGPSRAPAAGSDFFGLSPNLQASADEVRERDRRSRELELSRTISLYPAVQFARVHLNLAESDPFGKSLRKPSASVFLGLKPLRRLTPAQVATIRKLIAHAVEGLAVEQVTVADNRGQSYDPAAEDGRAGLDGLRQRMGLIRDAEAAAERKLEGHLELVLGDPRVRVSANAESGKDAGAPVVLTSVAVTVPARTLPAGPSREGARDAIRQTAHAILGIDASRVQVIEAACRTVRTSAMVAVLATAQGPVVSRLERQVVLEEGADPRRDEGLGEGASAMEPDEGAPVDPAGGSVPSAPTAPVGAAVSAAAPDLALPLGIFLLMAGTLGVCRLAVGLDCGARSAGFEAPLDLDGARFDPAMRRELAAFWAGEDPAFAARILRALARRKAGDDQVPGASIFLASLGARVAPEVLGQLPARDVIEVLAEIPRRVEAAGDADPFDPGLTPVAWLGTQRALAKKGPREARQLAERLLPGAPSELVLDELDALWDVEDASGPDEESAERDSRRLADQLALECPEAVALVLSLAPRSMARRALVYLLDDGRIAVAGAFARVAARYPAAFDEPELPEDVLSDLLDGLRSEVRVGVLEHLRAADPALHERLLHRTFAIRDIEAFDDGQLGELLARVPAEDLALSMREAPEQLRRRCTRLLPRGLRSAVLQMLDSPEPVRLRDLEAARARLGCLCRELGLIGSCHEAL